jgi:hypothetical protein
MIFRLALRSLSTRPIRTAVLACGFGFGIAVMAALLGVGAVILEQAHSPALQGGGDLMVLGRFGAVDSARFVMTSVLGAPALMQRAVAISPWKQSSLYLMSASGPIPVSATGGIPSLERAIGDPEIAPIAEWVDTPADRAWTSPSPGAILRAMDRFHPIPDTPEFAKSWAEWLYFNGHAEDGSLRFYLTFLAGPAAHTPGKRIVGVRLQVERNGVMKNYAAGGEVDERPLLESAPDLDIAGSGVRLEGGRYALRVAMPGASGELVLDPVPGRSLPPAAIQGARGWVSGYTAPVLSGTVHGSLDLSGEKVSFDNLAGYHDHNWGFWEGVRWQWGQVAHDDVSILYGRVFPPADVADPDRVPGFLGVLGREGPLGFSTAVSIEEHGKSAGQPDEIVIKARGRAIDIVLTLTVDRRLRTAMSMTQPGIGPALDFLQLGGEYTVTGKVGERELNFRSRGAAETFRPPE